MYMYRETLWRMGRWSKRNEFEFRLWREITRRWSLQGNPKLDFRTSAWIVNRRTGPTTNGLRSVRRFRKANGRERKLEFLSQLNGSAGGETLNWFSQCIVFRKAAVVTDTRPLKGLRRGPKAIPDTHTITSPVDLYALVPTCLRPECLNRFQRARDCILSLSLALCLKRYDWSDVPEPSVGHFLEAAPVSCSITAIRAGV